MVDNPVNLKIPLDLRFCRLHTDVSPLRRTAAKGRKSYTEGSHRPGSDSDLEAAEASGGRGHRVQPGESLRRQERLGRGRGRKPATADDLASEAASPAAPSGTTGDVKGRSEG